MSCNIYACPCQMPKHDILLTNPAYSSNHKERCLEYCAKSGKPWMLLMPAYVATKQYFKTLCANLTGGPPFFIVPATHYEYDHPEGTGHETSPFFSVWFVHLMEDTARIAASYRASKAAGVKIFTSVEELGRAGIVNTRKRLNPRQRKARKKGSSY